MLIESTGGNRERRLRSTLLTAALQKETVYRLGEKIGGTACYQQTADRSRCRNVHQTCQGIHLHQHTGLQQRGIYPRTERHQRSQGPLLLIHLIQPNSCQRSRFVGINNQS